MGIVSVFSTKGGVGKSLIALNLAHWLQPKYLIDSDVGSGLSDLTSLGTRFRPVLVRTRGQVEAATKDDGLTLADCGGFDSDVNRYVLAISDVILIPSGVTPSDQFGLLSTSKVLASISQATGNKMRGHIVINDVHPRQSDFSVLHDIVDARDNLSIIKPIIPHATVINNASLKGSAGTSGEIAAKFCALATSIKALLS